METAMKVIVLLLPLSYLLHCLEEFYFPGGFIEWYRGFRPSLSAQKPQYYLKVNIIAFIIVSIISISVFFFETSYNSFLIASTFLASNAFFTHILGTIKTRKYSPGLITGTFLYIPICLLGFFFSLYRGTLLTSDLIADLVLGSLYELWNIYKYQKKNRAS
ncbi:HXXEE domain-containing protein [Enterococcus sp. AZ072]|uniref:HXXEE domain-containing protein n=1 Tax=unclassified Enterococcus TaxID=2608891 RepID=UPI003D2A8DA0